MMELAAINLQTISSKINCFKEVIYKMDQIKMCLYKIVINPRNLARIKEVLKVLNQVINLPQKWKELVI
jgi:hypothetical protein